MQRRQEGLGGRVTDEQRAIASTMRNRVGKFKVDVLYDSLKKVVTNKKEYNGFQGQKFNQSAPAVVARLNSEECCDLQSAVDALVSVFSESVAPYDFTNFQKGGDGISIGSHKFNKLVDWSSYRRGESGIMSYKTESELKSMSISEFKVQKNFNASDWFNRQFGYKEGAAKILESWNQGVDFSRLKPGQKILLMQ